MSERTCGVLIPRHSQRYPWSERPCETECDLPVGHNSPHQFLFNGSRYEWESEDDCECCDVTDPDRCFWYGLAPSILAARGRGDMSAINLESVLAFGKYRGLPVAAVVRFNPSYLGWLRDQGKEMAADLVEVLRSALCAERKQSLQNQNAWAWGFGADVRSAKQRRDGDLIRIEHEERRKVGQETCHCFPHNWPSCPDCNGVGWISPSLPRQAPLV